MKRFSFLLFISLVLIMTGYFLAPNKQVLTISTRPVTEEIERSFEKKKKRRAGIFVPGIRAWLSKKRVREMLEKSADKESMIIYGIGKVEDFTASAPGTDGKHHVVNGYLVGYAPFSTKNIWVPWQVLAKKKKYQLDHLTFRGKMDVWQTSRQAHKFTRGDCEDHAIALADWLITMGEDARVVTGMFNGGGHAWVVLLKGKKQYLLEATQKNGVQGLKRLPLARQMRGYKPQYMFNKKFFWKNNGYPYIRNYSSSKWELKSHYNLGFNI